MRVLRVNSEDQCILGVWDSRHGGNSFEFVTQVLQAPQIDFDYAVFRAIVRRLENLVARCALDPTEKLTLQILKP